MTAFGEKEREKKVSPHQEKPRNKSRHRPSFNYREKLVTPKLSILVKRKSQCIFRNLRNEVIRPGQQLDAYRNLERQIIGRRIPGINRKEKRKRKPMFPRIWLLVLRYFPVAFIDLRLF